MGDYRQEADSLGTINVPAEALYRAQTQRAIDNFPIQRKFPKGFLQALAFVKQACAKANAELQLLDGTMADSIVYATEQIITQFEAYEKEFPLSIYQTGSGTSTNMNMNEVLSTIASKKLNAEVHPNDKINMSQSSNDVIPTAMNVAAYVEAADRLLPAMKHLYQVILAKAASVEEVVKTGRTHLMDAMPITMAQELRGWSVQIGKGMERIASALTRVRLIAIGGTAVGTGINCHPEFGKKVAAHLHSTLGHPFEQNYNLFESLSAADAIVELSAQLKVVAVSLMKIANDLRWMNSGPIAGFSEIALPALQPGSSIMPGKINPVIPEAVAMVCAQVMGNDTTTTIAGQSGSFQLNVMLPVLAYNVLESEELLASACTMLADKAITGFEVNTDRVTSFVDKNPILVTALNPIVGYETGAQIAKTAYAQERNVLEVAKELTSLSDAELQTHLNPVHLTKGGIAK